MNATIQDLNDGYLQITLENGFSYRMFDGRALRPESVTATSAFGGRPTTFCLIFNGNDCLKCDPRQGAAVSNREIDVHTRTAYAQSWEIIFFPKDGVYQFRNTDGTFLGVIDGNVGDVSGAPGNLTFWELLNETGTQSYRIKLKNGDYLKINGTTVVLVNTSNNATLWNFDISTTVPPGKNS